MFPPAVLWRITLCFVAFVAFIVFILFFFVCISATTLVRKLPGFCCFTTSASLLVWRTSVRVVRTPQLPSEVNTKYMTAKQHTYLSMCICLRVCLAVTFVIQTAVLPSLIHSQIHSFFLHSRVPSII